MQTDASSSSSNRHSMVVTRHPPSKPEAPKVRPQSEVITSSASLQGVPVKPPRKKRPAPPPPSVQKPPPQPAVRSRSSSHSSGYGEGSPGTTTGRPQDALSLDSGETTLPRTGRKKRPAPAPPPPLNGQCRMSHNVRISSMIPLRWTKCHPSDVI